MIKANLPPLWLSSISSYFPADFRTPIQLSWHQHIYISWLTRVYPQILVDFGMITYSGPLSTPLYFLVEESVLLVSRWPNPIPAKFRNAALPGWSHHTPAVWLNPVYWISCSTLAYLHFSGDSTYHHFLVKLSIPSPSWIIPANAHILVNQSISPLLSWPTIYLHFLLTPVPTHSYLTPAVPQLPKYTPLTGKTAAYPTS